MSDFRLLGSMPIQLPIYTYQLLCNVAREAGVSPVALAANVLSSLAAQPSFMQDVLDSSAWYQTNLKGGNDHE